SVTATAVVPPEQEVVVSAPVGGLVTRLLIAEGSEVEAGDPLLELRSLELLGAQREFVDAVSASRLADAQRERDSLLHEEGIIAQRRVDESESEALAARIRAEQAREHLRIVGAGDDELEELASSGRISAAVTLRAPGPGVVLERHGAVGEQVEALEPLVRLADLKRMWLEARVPQERADAVARGMRLVALVDKTPVGGEIFQVGRVVDPVTQTVIVRAAADNAEQRLRADQVLRARVLSVGPSGAGTYAAPMSAIARVAGSAYVFERMPTGLRLVPVTVHGEEGSEAHFAADGLGAGSEIAVRGVS